MLKNFQEEIFEKLTSIKEMDKELFIHLLSRIDFGRFERIKKNILQIIRLLLAGEFKEVFNRKSAKEIIDIINQPFSKKKILYIGLEPTFNIVRESIYLRGNGFQTIALIESPWGVSFAKKYFDFVFIYRSRYELIYILSKVKPYLIHIQGAAARSDYFGILAKLFSTVESVFEFYDLRSLCHKKEDAIALDGKNNAELSFFSEKFAFQNSSGIILSYDPKIFNSLKEKYKVSPPLLEFHQYTCEEFIAKSEREKLSKKDGKIHLVFGGLVAHLKLPKKLFGDIQFQELIDIIIKQEIFFHIYLSPQLSPKVIWKLLGEYRKISDSYFSIKEGIPPDEAPQEFSQYDYGVMFYLFDKGTCLQEHLSTRLPGKFFSYLESGLPIIVSEELEYVASMTKKYQIGIVVAQEEIKNLSKIISKYDYNKLKSNVEVARKELSMDKNIGRLIKFYESLAV